jgi:radical SAM superfamily enzyme YgiQ (UPF0313 family)
MRIALISLPKPYLTTPESQPPLGVLYLAGILTQSYDVKVFNFASKLTWEALADLQAENMIEKFDIIGISITSLEITQANRFAHAVKEFSKAPIVVGGPGVLNTTIKFMDKVVIDHCVIGECESNIIQIMDDIDGEEWDSSITPHIHRGIPPLRLSSLPFPRRDLAPNGKAIFANGENFHEGASTVIVSSRGCPCRCSFCSSPGVSNKIRFRESHEFVNEIEHVVKTLGIRQFRFSDDMFLADVGRAEDICNIIVERKLDISWRISTRVRPFNRKIADMLVRAGCKEVSFGIESFDDNVLQMLQKGTTAKDNESAICAAKESGLLTRALMMIKTPGQTKHTVDLNIEALMRCRPTLVACTVFVPLPGSAIYDHPEKFSVNITDLTIDKMNFYFFGSSGENAVWDGLEIGFRDKGEVMKETIRFREWLKSNNLANRG